MPKTTSPPPSTSTPLAMLLGVEVEAGVIRGTVGEAAPAPDTTVFLRSSEVPHFALCSIFFRSSEVPRLAPGSVFMGAEKILRGGFYAISMPKYLGLYTIKTQSRSCKLTRKQRGSLGFCSFP